MSQKSIILYYNKLIILTHKNKNMNEIDEQIICYIEDLQRILNNSRNMSSFEKILDLHHIGNDLIRENLDDYTITSQFKNKSTKK